MLNGINERGLSKNQDVKIQSFPGSTTETIPDKIETLVAEKPDCKIMHVGTNDITNGINSLICATEKCTSNHFCSFDYKFIGK